MAKQKQKAKRRDVGNLLGQSPQFRPIQAALDIVHGKVFDAPAVEKAEVEAREIDLDDVAGDDGEGDDESDDDEPDGTGLPVPLERGPLSRRIPTPTSKPGSEGNAPEGGVPPPEPKS